MRNAADTLDQCRAASFAVRAGLLAVFVPLGLVLVLTTPVSWRGYLMAWLIVHMLLATVVVIAEGDWRQIWAVAVSLAGLLWLWVREDGHTPMLTGVYGG